MSQRKCVERGGGGLPSGLSARRPDQEGAVPGLLLHLQRSAGNRAVVSLAQRSASLVVQRAPSPEATETLPVAVDFAIENGFSRSVPHRGDVARWLTQMAASGSGQSQRAQQLLEAIDPDGNASWTRSTLT
jgi:hypothetical protein